MQARVIIAPNASHLMSVVTIWRYLVLVTLKKPKGPTIRMKTERATLEKNYRVESVNVITDNVIIRLLLSN
jgi:hypothetical protein